MKPPILDDFRRDAAFSLRSLRRSPAFTLVAVLCLALGIGANAAIFSVLNAVLLRPLPYAEPERLVRAYETLSGGGRRGSVSFANFLDWREQGTGFERLAAWAEGSFTLQGAGGQPEQIPVIAGTAGLFQLLGARPVAGRVFSARGETGNVVVLSEKLWRRR
ncbi:MAG TPA: ABC transporter permease, partial [Thermoanaerobaculia bacterium]